MRQNPILTNSQKNWQEFRDALGRAYSSDVSSLRNDLTHLRDRFAFTVVRTDLVSQQASISCPAGQTLISAACVGNNGSAQVAVGPIFNADGSIGCYRYGGTVMPVQATAVCLQIK
jgi:hypothetical protein